MRRTRNRETQRLRRWFLGLMVATLVHGVTSAAAQEQTPAPKPAPLVEPPIAPYVFDVRGLMANLKPSNAIAANVGMDDASDLPGRGFGFSVGAHVYPLR